MQKLLKRLENLIPISVSQNLLKYFTVTVLLAVPLYPKFPFIRVPGTYVSIRLEDFVLFLAFVVWFIYILPNWRKLFTDRFFQVISAFWLVGLVSTLSAIFLTNSVEAHIGILHWVRRIEYILPFFLGLETMRRKANLAFFVKVLMVVIFFVFLYGIGQKHFNLPIVTTQNEEYAKGRALYFTVSGHLVSTFAGHYDLASFLILVTPILVTILVSNKALEELAIAKDKRIARLILTFTLFESLWLLIFTASRISIVSYLVAISIPLFLLRKYWVIPLVVLSVFVFTMFSGNLLARYQNIFQVVKEKITYQIEETITVQAASIGSVLAAEDRSSSIRFDVEWPRAIRAFNKNPILGTGFSSITLATDNDYLRLLGELGLLGVLSFSLIFFRLKIEYLGFITKKGILNFKEKLQNIDLGTVFTLSIIGAIVGTLINAVFIDIFEASKFAISFWLLVGMSIGVIKEEIE